MTGRITKTAVVLGVSVLALIASVGAPVVAHADEATCAPMTTPVYQRIDPDSKSNFLTTSSTEAADAVGQGYTDDEGTPFAVSPTDEDGLRAVHQLYRETTGDYLWTISATEVASATARGNYVDQGISFYAATASADCGIPVYRVRGFRQHRLVVGSSDRDALVDAGWISEGVAFYAAETSSPAAPAPPAPPAPAGDTNFSIAVMPDTQQEVLKASDPRFKNRTDWLVKNKSALDLRFVTSSGDVVNWDTPDHSQYEVASAAMKPLEAANIPYSLAIGNHDTAAVCAGGAACDASKTSTLFRDTSTFNDYFTADRFGAVQGAFEPGKVDNEYSTFSAGGAKWLVLVMEMWPREAAVNWAEDVVSSHSDYNVIVVTHSYLDASGNIASQTPGAGRTTPQWLFDNFIKQYANIKFVFSGHVGLFGNRVDTGVNGNKIYSFLQTMHDSYTNPVRLVTFDTKANTLKTWIYSPYTDATTSGSTVNLSGLSLVH
jgi:hypothetical protein